MTTDGALTAEVTITESCVSAVVRFAVDGVPVPPSDPVALGGTTGEIIPGPVSPGTHTLTVGADIPFLASCDERFWSGNLTVKRAAPPTRSRNTPPARASGLQNLGDGIYQLNWATQKAFAGSCRRLRLDLGERNPDGTVFYRMADFQFTR